jgi:hypothetical protein
LIHPDKVDRQPLRPDRLIDALLPTPIAANGQIQNEVKWLVERPLFVAAAGFFFGDGEIRGVVDQKINLLRCPVDGVRVKIVRGTGNDFDAGFVGVFGVVVGFGVNGAVNLVFVETDVFP